MVLAVAGAAVLTLGLWASAQLTPDRAPEADILPIPTQAPPTAAPTAAPPTATTPPANQPLVRIAALGDSGTRGGDQARVAQQIAAADKQGRPFDALLITGDLVYEKGDADLTDASVVTPYSATFQRSEIYPALGNHDVDSDEGEDIMRRLGRTPTFVANIGPVHVVSVNSNNVSDNQTAWLRQALAAAPKTPGTWIVPIMHHPAYSSGKHGSEEPVRKRWVPLFGPAGVELVLAGHDHSYERTEPQAGVTYITTGGGGADLYDVGRSGFTAASAKRHHFLDLNVFADRIEGRAIDKSGQVFDTFTIANGAQPSAVATPAQPAASN